MLSQGCEMTILALGEVKQIEVATWGVYKDQLFRHFNHIFSCH